MTRKRASIYDPFKDDIVKWCNSGMPVKDMIVRIGPGYSEQGLYAYIARKGLRTKEAVYEARRKCSKCPFCHDYINTNRTKGRICSMTWRTIQPNVVNSPTWCELGKTYDKV